MSINEMDINDKKTGNIKDNVINKKKGARFVIEFSKDDNEIIETFNSFFEKCNNKDFGRRITWTDIFKHLLVANNTDKTIKEIQESILTKEDKVLLKLKELNEKDGSSLTVIELAARALKIQ